MIYRLRELDRSFWIGIAVGVAIIAACAAIVFLVGMRLWGG